MEQKKKKQMMRYSDEELSLIKNTFADNDDLLAAIRKHFLQMPLDAIDQQMLTSIRSSKQVLALIRKTFLPELEPNAPRHQLVDLWLTVEMKDKSVDEAWPHLLSRETLVTYLEQQLENLEKNKDTTMVSLEKLKSIKGKDKLQAYADLEARNTAISHTEQQLTQWVILAGQKNETVEETKKRLERNSTK